LSQVNATNWKCGPIQSRLYKQDARLATIKSQAYGGAGLVFPFEPNEVFGEKFNQIQSISAYYLLGGAVIWLPAQLEEQRVV
jgi:hypothetical protein